MSNNSQPSIEQTLQQAIDECTGSMQAALEEFTSWLKSERRQSSTPPLNHYEDSFSPLSSDEYASIESPILENDEHDTVRIHDYTIFQPNTHSISQDLYKSNSQNKENNDQRLFPTLSNNTDNTPTTHCDTKARSFKLPEVTFTGCICTSTIQKTLLSVPEIVTEGLLVNKFLDDFEYHIKESSLNIENHWYGLMEISFKNVREKHIELYLWFKKRLYEGLNWAGARAIIKHQLGFDSCNSRKVIKEALTKYRQGPRETFEGFYYRFKSYVAACNALSLYPDYVLIRQFIISLHTDVKKYIMECLTNQLYLKTKVKIMTLPSEENNLLLHETQCFKVLKEINLSWEEFISTIVSTNFQTLRTISQKRVQQTNDRRTVKNKKSFEHKKQRYFGGTGKKTIKFA